MRQLLVVAMGLLAAGCAVVPEARVAGQQGGFSDAVASPLYDFNVLQTKIPPVLIAARDRPYDLPDRVDCSTLAAMVAQLDDVLGPDLDTPANADDPSLLERGGNLAQGAVEGAAENLIPLRGWVRVLTGAERYDRLVRESITAGGVRRSFLKGLGQARGCGTPASPTAAALAGQIIDPINPPRRGPQYPVR